MLRFIPAAKADIDLFFGDGLEMYHQFLQNPAGFPAYIKEIFTITDFNIGRTDSDFIRTVFDGIKFIHFLLNLLSGGHLFTNVLLFNILAAHLFLRCWVYLKHATGSAAWGFWLFLFPSAFFFTSVILKEGIEWCLMAAIIPAGISIFQHKTWKPVPLVLLLVGLLFFFKYLIAATFCGAVLLYLLLRKYPAYRLYMVVLLVAVFLIVFFNAGYIHPSLNLPEYLVNRRMEFLALEATTELHMQPLAPTAGSFLQVLPEAVTNVFLRPFPAEIQKPFYYAFVAELYAFYLIIVLLLVRGRFSLAGNKGALAIALLMFALINMLIIGYTITNTGAIIRYRSIFLPCMGAFFWMAWQAGDVFGNLIAGIRKKLPFISETASG